jgi:hypothetical protein
VDPPPAPRTTTGPAARTRYTPRERPSPPPGDDIWVTSRTLIAAVVLSALIATGITAAAVIAIVDHGPAGPPGEQGIPGPPGKGTRASAGDRPRAAALSTQALVDAIDKDPDAVADALRESLGAAPAGTDTGSTDSAGIAAPSATVDDLQTSVDTLRDDFDTLCRALVADGALVDTSLPC